MTTTSTAQPSDSTKHPYSAQYKAGDTFNTYEGRPAVFQPITSEEKQASVQARRDLIAARFTNLMES